MNGGHESRIGKRCRPGGFCIAQTRRANIADGVVDAGEGRGTAAGSGRIEADVASPSRSRVSNSAPGCSPFITGMRPPVSEFR